MSFFAKRTARLTCLWALVLPLFVLTTDPGQAQDAASDDYSFVVVGHPRGEADNEPYYLRDELIAEVARLEPDLVVFTGDMIWGDWFQPGADPARITEHWERFDAAWGQLGVPLFRVPGNHDLNDPVTRDVYFERYGPLPKAETFRNSRFLLLGTPVVPEGDTPPTLPRSNSRVTELDPAHVAFLREEAAGSDAYDHTFIFTHHVVWRSMDWAWWRDVEPALVGSTVRAVFSGDFGPAKYAYRKVNGIEYFQSAVGEFRRPDQIHTVPGVALNLQFDTFLHVTVSGDEVHVDVRPFAAKEADGRHTPEYWDTALSPRPKSTVQKIRDLIGGPKRQALLAGLLVLGFILGVLVTRWLGRRT